MGTEASVKKRPGRKKVTHGERPMVPCWCVYDANGDFSHWVKAWEEEEALTLARKRDGVRVERTGD